MPRNMASVASMPTSTHVFAATVIECAASVKDRVAGESFRRNWDERHAVKLGVTTSRGLWDLSFAWSYHTGWPTTALSLETQQNPDGSTSTVAVPGSRNAERFGPFSSLDMRASRLYDLPRGSLLFFVEITNSYNRSQKLNTRLNFVNVSVLPVPGSVSVL